MKKMIWILFLLILFGTKTHAEEEILNNADLQEIEAALKEIPGTESFSFRETLSAFLKGEIPFHLEDLYP